VLSKKLTILRLDRIISSIVLKEKEKKLNKI